MDAPLYCLPLSTLHWKDSYEKKGEVSLNPRTLGNIEHPAKVSGDMKEALLARLLYLENRGVSRSYPILCMWGVLHQQIHQVKTSVVSFFFILWYLSFPSIGLATQMPVGQMPVRKQQAVNQNIRQMHKGGPPWMCGQHNVRATARDNTGQNI